MYSSSYEDELSHNIFDYSRSFLNFNYDLLSSVTDIFGDFNSDITLKTFYRIRKIADLTIGVDSSDINVDLSIRCEVDDWFGASLNFDITPDTKFNNSDIQYHKYTNNLTYISQLHLDEH